MPVSGAVHANGWHIQNWRGSQSYVEMLICGPLAPVWRSWFQPFKSNPSCWVWSEFDGWTREFWFLWSCIMRIVYVTYNTHTPGCVVYITFSLECIAMLGFKFQDHTKHPWITRNIDFIRTLCSHSFLVEISDDLGTMGLAGIPRPKLVINGATVQVHSLSRLLTALFCIEFVLDPAFHDRLNAGNRKVLSFLEPEKLPSDSF